MQAWSLQKKIQVTQTKFLEFCQKTNWKVSISFSGGADSTVLLDMFCRFWSNNREAHNNSSILVIYANTSNEFISMPKHVEFMKLYFEEKYNVVIELKVVRAKENYMDIVKTIGYPVGSKKISRMIRDVRVFLKTKYGSVNKFNDFVQYLPRNINKTNDNKKRSKVTLDDRLASANKFRELGFSHTIVLRLTGITSENNLCVSWQIPKKWEILIIAPFDVSEECCEILKKAPMREVYQASDASPIIGTLAEDSKQRQEAYLQVGCISFKENGKGKSTPMGFWLRQNVLEYLYIFTIPTAPPYCDLILNEDGTFEFTGEHNTGCKLCLFGCHLEKEPNRIQRLAKLEPNTYNAAMRDINDHGFGYKKVMDYCNMKWEV